MSSQTKGSFNRTADKRRRTTQFTPPQAATSSSATSSSATSLFAPVSDENHREVDENPRPLQRTRINPADIIQLAAKVIPH